jgi:lipoate-protein ligase A
MRIDRELLDWAEKCSDKISVVRFYRWAVPTISLGKHQKVEEAVNQIYCQRAAIPIVHRPTGGRAVFHDHELTYSLVSNHAKYFPLESVKDTYRAIAAALRAGLQSLGIFAQLAKGARGSPPLAPSNGGKKPCFMTPSPHELLLGGYKLAGGAQRRLKRSFLQQGCFPLQVDYSKMAVALGVQESVLRSTLLSVSQASGHQVAFEALCEALKEGFEKTFRVQLRQGVTRPQAEGGGTRLRVAQSRRMISSLRSDEGGGASVENL